MTQDIQTSEFNIQSLAIKCQGSFFFFCQIYYPLLTGRNFIISHPIGRESHFITIAKILTKCLRGEVLRVILNLPPGHGKSTMLCLWVAWCMSIHPDSQFLYISYSSGIATAQTSIIKQIMSLKEYIMMFDVKIRHDSKAKDLFQTKEGGFVGAFGSSGTITGRNAGLPGAKRFTGALIIDDAHKPDEVSSDTMRESVISNWKATLSQRLRSSIVPVIFLGQRLHEADLPGFLIDGGDGHEWNKVILTSLDEFDRPLYPEAYPLQYLNTIRETSPYVWASQHMQNPIPAGGALFKPEYFVTLEKEPNCLLTFIVCDTAETDKSYNDATVYSFFGLYKIKTLGRETDQLGLHWIDCAEIRVRPEDLESEWMEFWTNCMRHKTHPTFCIIEKKSTGSSLIGSLRDIRGIKIIDAAVVREKQSKTQRFLDVQPVIYRKMVSVRDDQKLKSLVIPHMCKITANESHRFDDIADTLADAVKAALIQNIIKVSKDDNKEIADIINHKLKNDLQSKRGLYQNVLL